MHAHTLIIRTNIFSTFEKKFNELDPFRNSYEFFFRSEVHVYTSQKYNFIIRTIHAGYVLSHIWYYFAFALPLTRVNWLIYPNFGFTKWNRHVVTVRVVWHLTAANYVCLTKQIDFNYNSLPLLGCRTPTLDGSYLLTYIELQLDLALRSLYILNLTQ